MSGELLSESPYHQLRQARKGRATSSTCSDIEVSFLHFATYGILVPRGLRFILRFFMKEDSIINLENSLEQINLLLILYVGRCNYITKQNTEFLFPTQVSKMHA